MSIQIKKYRKLNNLTQAEAAYKVGVSPSAFAMYERGEREPGIDTLKKMSETFKVDIDTLVGSSRPFISYGSSAERLGIRSDIINAVVRDRKNGVAVPVLGYVAAGIPIDAITDIIDYEEIDAAMVKDGSEYFALQLKGDSMEPRMKSGDVVIVRKQEQCDSGDIAIVGVNGDDATCKKVILHESGISLVPLNPAFEVMFFTAEEIEKTPVRIYGKVVELRAKF